MCQRLGMRRRRSRMYGQLSAALLISSTIQARRWREPDFCPPMCLERFTHPLRHPSAIRYFYHRLAKVHPRRGYRRAVEEPIHSLIQELVLLRSNVAHDTQRIEEIIAQLDQTITRLENA